MEIVLPKQLRASSQKAFKCYTTLTKELKTCTIVKES